MGKNALETNDPVDAIEYFITNKRLQNMIKSEPSDYMCITFSILLAVIIGDFCSVGLMLLIWDPVWDNEWASLIVNLWFVFLLVKYASNIILLVPDHFTHFFSYAWLCICMYSQYSLFTIFILGLWLYKMCNPVYSAIVNDSSFHIWEAFYNQKVNK
jgi:hypothetical protein